MRIDAQQTNSHPSPDRWDATGGGRGRVNPPPSSRISEILTTKRNTEEEYEVVAPLTLNHLTPVGWWDYGNFGDSALNFKAPAMFRRTD